MKEEYLDYKNLRKIQQEEKSSPSLIKINDHFFQEATSYYTMLHTRLKKEEKPSRNLIISEQIQQVEKIIRSIYECREKKIMLSAMSKARGGNPSEKHLLDQEKQLFSSIYSLLVSNRKILLNNDLDQIEIQEKEQININTKSTEQNTRKDSTNHIIIRILDTIPTFIGTDSKQYTLRKNDIISVPKDLATMLINKQVAEIVETQI